MPLNPGIFILEYTIKFSLLIFLKGINSVAQEISHFSFCPNFIQKLCILSFRGRIFLKKTRDIFFLLCALVQLSPLIDINYPVYRMNYTHIMLEETEVQTAIIKTGIKVSRRQTSSRKAIWHNG